MPRAAMPPAFAAVTPETASSTTKQDRGAAPSSRQAYLQMGLLGPLVRRVNEYPVDVEDRSLEPFPLAARSTAIGACSTR